MNYIDISKQAPADPIARRQWLRENFKRVAVSPKWVLRGVSDSDTLRRFVDLPKLFDLLKNKHLVLPAIRKLIEADPFECSAKKSLDNVDRSELMSRAKQLEQYAPESTYSQFRIPFPLDSPLFRSRDFDSDIEHWTLDELKEAVWYLERERLKYNLVCSCWHKGTVESDAMWKIYASQLGVFIGSSASRLQQSIKMILPQIYIEQAELNLVAVQYEDTNKCRDTEPWLIKRKAFQHEKEVRLYCDVPFVFGSEFELMIEEPSTLIEEIVITPFAAAWQVASIKGAIEALLGEINAGQIPVRQSKHMRAPLDSWPSAPQLQNENEAKTVIRPALGAISDGET